MTAREAVAETLPSDAQQTCLRFEDSTVAVSTSAGDLRWLVAFLNDCFEELSCVSPDYRVVLGVDATAYDRCLRAGEAGTGLLVEGFAKDHKTASFERWPAIGAGSTYHDGRRRIFYSVSDDGRRVEMLVREGTRSCRTALMRVVRELTMARIVATGGVLVHGAVIGTQRGAIAVSGPKRSGKTTLLMSLLAMGGGRYIANDRCVLRSSPEGASVRGLPTLVSIRTGSLSFFPGLQQRVGRVRSDIEPSAPRFSLTPPQFFELMGDCPRDSGGRLAALLYPRVTEDPARLRLRRLDASEALECFHRGLFRASKPTLLGEVFVPAAEVGRSPAPRDVAAGIDQWVADHVPCFEVLLGGGRAPNPSECIELLAKVSGE